MRLAFILLLAVSSLNAQVNLSLDVGYANTNVKGEIIQTYSAYVYNQKPTAYIASNFTNNYKEKRFFGAGLSLVAFKGEHSISHKGGNGEKGNFNVHNLRGSFTPLGFTFGKKIKTNLGFGAFYSFPIWSNDSVVSGKADKPYGGAPMIYTVQDSYVSTISNAGLFSSLNVHIPISEKIKISLNSRFYWGPGPFSSFTSYTLGAGFVYKTSYKKKERVVEHNYVQ